MNCCVAVVRSEPRAKETQGPSGGRNLNVQLNVRHIGDASAPPGIKLPTSLVRGPTTILSLGGFRASRRLGTTFGLTIPVSYPASTSPTFVTFNATQPQCTLVHPVAVMSAP